MKASGILCIYLLLVNTIAFTLMGVDKRRAIRGDFRIPEATLFLYAAIGGVPGALFGMLIFSHKTRKWRFRLGLPLILLFQLALVTLLMLVMREISFL